MGKAYAMLQGIRFKLLGIPYTYPLLAWDAARVALALTAALAALLAWRSVRSPLLRGLVAFAFAAFLVSLLLRPTIVPAVLGGASASVLAFVLLRAKPVPWVPLALALFAAGGSVMLPLQWQRQADERLIVRDEQRRRPGDDWPRGGGHALIGPFGARGEDKGWIEAGGSFSPAYASFGLSIRAYGPDGRLLSTSNDVPLALTRHAYEAGAGLPAVMAETPHFGVSYEVAGTRRYRVEVAPKEGASLELALRSAGPAGAPITSIRTQGSSLLLNGRWQIALPEGARVSAIGDELQGFPGRDGAAGPIASEKGWAFARIALPAGVSHLTIHDIAASSAARPVPGSLGCVTRGVPAPIADVLSAQVPALLMGLVGDETRPGDPINYPLQWQRDGAYIVTALARCGQADTAARLAGRLARQDFFGGFGAEADAPGLALWALGEAATATGDPAFVPEHWEAIRRKAGLIGEMRAAKAIVRKPFSGPVVPGLRGQPDNDLVAWPARGGLIAGRMDHHQPIYFVNAASILGLEEAARMAEVAGDVVAARIWRAEAGSLKQAYRKAMAAGPDDVDALNERTLINALYPTYAADPERVRALLSRVPPTGGERPLWTYFTLATAHQRLIVGDREGARQTLAWFASQDPLPGLGVFWEGSGEENTFGLWHRTRGWVRPTGVMPHYWSSAEALLLALEMLAYADLERSELVIGAGLSPAELAGPVCVQQIGTARGPVSWQWDGAGTLRVWGPAGLRLRAGSGFPAGTELRAEPVAAC